MAYVAETVGAQPISFMDGAGEVMAGAKEAAVLYGAQQKAETMKLELENARIKQDGMKAGIFLDYMDKIKNAPNPTVKKILERQYAAQHEKMYGQPMDAETLKAITESPDFGSTLQNLIQGMGIEGAGKEYANMVNQLATALGLPYVDAQKVMKQAFDYYLEEKKAKQLAEITSLKQTGVQGRFERTQDVSAVKFEQDVSKDIESKREKLTAIDRNLVLVEKAKTIDKMPSERQIVFDDQLVTAYTKMQDPTSVVMPSEYQRTMSTMPKIDQLEVYLSKQFKKGGLLDPKQRQVMIEYLKGFSEDQLNRFNKYVDSSAKRVDQLGASGDEIRKLKFSMGRSEQAPQALNQNQQNAINAYVQRNVPYDVFAQKNPNTAKILGRAEYEKMLKQSKAGQ